MERLNKWLARAGVTSRRGADRLIEQGRVRVNGRVVKQPGSRLRPGVDAVKVDGRRVAPPPSAPIYLLLNKPRGVVTTLSDPEGRPTIRDLLRGVNRRVFPVGRLDYHSEGLLLLTDDGDLARDLLHPSGGVAKTYSVKVRGTPAGEALRRLRRGVVVDGRPTLPARVRLVRPGPNSWLEVTVREGRKHQVRLMLQQIGHPVLKLKRIRIDGLDLAELPAGRLRSLSALEVARLKRAARASRAGGSERRPRRGRAT
jgi:pseudouridine synthase